MSSSSLCNRCHREAPALGKKKCFTCLEKDRLRKGKERLNKSLEGSISPNVRSRSNSQVRGLSLISNGEPYVSFPIQNEEKQAENRSGALPPITRNISPAKKLKTEDRHASTSLQFGYREELKKQAEQSKQNKSKYTMAWQDEAGIRHKQEFEEKKNKKCRIEEELKK